ncbi:hypothetical protein HanIR_Chr01g0006071 [Helianthus annuus]|nr:hypothetical protein HanIR_Chr01g0006071 [Helianthus annuus]
MDCPSLVNKRGVVRIIKGVRVSCKIRGYLRVLLQGDVSKFYMHNKWSDHLSDIRSELFSV